MKNIAGDIIKLFAHASQKSQLYDVRFFRYGVRHAYFFFVILGHFLPIYHTTNNTQNQNFEKIKNTWRYYWFTTVYHKLQSYHVWFLRYGLPRTEFFVILHNFLPFYITPLTATKIKLFKKIFKIRQILSFYKYVP